MGNDIVDKAYEQYNKRNIDKMLEYYDEEYTYIRLVSGEIQGTGKTYMRNRSLNEFKEGWEVTFKDTIEWNDLIIKQVVFRDNQQNEGSALVVFLIENDLIKTAYSLGPGECAYEYVVENIYNMYNDKNLKELSSNWTSDVEYRNLRYNKLRGKGIEWINDKDEKEFKVNWVITLHKMLSSDMFVVSYISFQNQSGYKGTGVKILRFREDKVSHVYEFDKEE